MLSNVRSTFGLWLWLWSLARELNTPLTANSGGVGLMGLGDAWRFALGRSRGLLRLSRSRIRVRSIRLWRAGRILRNF